MSPTEIEDVIYTHPAVKLACVVSVEDDSAGEVPLACIILKDGHSATEQELTKLVAGHCCWMYFMVSTFLCSRNLSAFLLKMHRMACLTEVFNASRWMLWSKCQYLGWYFHDLISTPEERYYLVEGWQQTIRSSQDLIAYCCPDFQLFAKRRQYHFDWLQRGDKRTFPLETHYLFNKLIVTSAKYLVE